MIKIADDELLTTKEVAVRADLHFRHVGSLVRQGKLTGQKVGNGWLILASSVAAYMSNPRKPGPKPHAL